MPIDFQPPPQSTAQIQPATNASFDEQYEQARALANGGSCTESGQCRTLPLGAMACGGPEGYLPYSMSGTDEKALRALAEQYKAERQAASKTGGMMSICRHMPDPGAVCVSGSCQLGASAPASAR